MSKEALRPGGSGQEHGDFPNSSSMFLLINPIRPGRDCEHKKMQSMRVHLSSRSFDVELSPLQAEGRSQAMPCEATTKVEAHDCLAKTTNDG